MRYWLTELVRVARTRELPLRTRAVLGFLRPVHFRQPIQLKLPGGGVCIVEPSDGNIDIRTLIEIFADGTYRAEYNGRQVLDLGAHRGYFGAYALTRGASMVVSYEPEAKNFELLRRCAASFPERSWDVVHAAVGASEGEGTLYLREESWGHTLVKRDQIKEVATQNVAIHSFERAVSRFPADGPSLLVKMDVEGSEADLVMDVPSAVWAPVSELLIEIEPFCRVDAEALLAKLSELGLEPAGSPRGRVHHLIRVGK